MDDSKLLQKSNLTGGSHAQSCYTSNLTLPHQASEGLINLRGFPGFASLHPLRGANSVRQHQRTRCFPLLYRPSPTLWTLPNSMENERTMSSSYLCLFFNMDVRTHFKTVMVK